MALRTSSDDLNAPFTVARPAPLNPARRVMVWMIELRTCSGANAATTMSAGNSDTNALAASATLRSTNSFSSTRSQICQRIERSTHSWTGSNRRRMRVAARFDASRPLRCAHAKPSRDASGDDFDVFDVVPVKQRVPGDAWRALPAVGLHGLRELRARERDADDAERDLERPRAR